MDNLSVLLAFLLGVVVMRVTTPLITNHYPTAPLCETMSFDGTTTYEGGVSIKYKQGQRICRQFTAQNTLITFISGSVN